jgi:hypothetical protein
MTPFGSYCSKKKTLLPISLATSQIREDLPLLGGGMFKERPSGCAWRDAWRGGVGILVIRGHSTVPDLPAASLAESR